jgi:glycerate 2-kinase
MADISNDRLLTRSLRDHAWGSQMARVMAAGLAEVDPKRVVARYLRRQGSRLWASDRPYDLDSIDKIWLVGAGKAGAPMAEAAGRAVGDRLSGGLVVVKEGHLPLGPTNPALEKVEFFEASHPVPDQRGLEAARRMIRLLESAGENDLVICLISGGGSALLNAPPAGISLEDLQALTGALLASGADIQEINSLRKHLDRVKGGGLARAAAPAQVLTLILSDVIDDPLDVIASGPTSPDPTTFAQAWSVLEKYDLASSVPPSIRERLERGRRGELAETPKEGDPIFARVQNLVVGSNRLAAEASLRQAISLGFEAHLLTVRLRGEARQAGRALAALGQQAARADIHQPVCLIAGGETTVHIRGDGIGGRNQELALAAVELLAGYDNIFLASLATDGGDGPTQAAGAVASGATWQRARQLGLDPADYLERNDSYSFFEPLGDLFLTGPTLTNVNDLVFLFVFPKG